MLIGIAIPFISKLIPGLELIWDNAWTIGLLISLAVYTWMMKGDATIMSAKDYEQVTERTSTSRAS